MQRFYPQARAALVATCGLFRRIARHRLPNNNSLGPHQPSAVVKRLSCSSISVHASFCACADRGANISMMGEPDFRHVAPGYQKKRPQEYFFCGGVDLRFNRPPPGDLISPSFLLLFL